MIKILATIALLITPLFSGCKGNCKETADAINNAAKAVVNLYVMQVDQREIFNPFLNDPTFQFFFGPNILPNQPQARLGSGSGVIVSADGLLVTCAHVVKQAKQIKVRLNDGREFEADIIYPSDKVDDQEDIAILKIRMDKTDILPVAKIGDSDNLVITEPIYAVGNAFGIGQSITGGIISAINRVVENLVMIQIDAAVNPGNSGGAVFNQYGEYIGIPSAIATRTGANHGVGFMRPVSLVKVLLKKLADKTLDSSIWLGLSYQEFTYDLAKALDGFDLKNYNGGVLVTQVNSKSPFLKDIKEQDVILKLNDYPVDSIAVLEFRLKLILPKDKATITLWRQKEGLITVSAKLVPIPESEQAKPYLLTGKHMLSGFTIADVTDDLIQNQRLPKSLKGKVIILKTPQKRGGVFNFSLLPGDELTEINEKLVKSAQDVFEQDQKGIHSITARRGNQEMRFFQQ